jgi:hypothetical protein
MKIRVAAFSYAKRKCRPTASSKLRFDEEVLHLRGTTVTRGQMTCDVADDCLTHQRYVTMPRGSASCG